MDLRIVVTISTLLLMSVDHTHLVSPVTVAEAPDNTTNNSNNCFCPSAAPQSTATPTTRSSAPSLGLITVIWNKCVGDIHLTLFHPSNSSSHYVCHRSKTTVQKLWKNVCESKKGCKDTLRWVEGNKQLKGYHITESGGEERTDCMTLRVQCTDEVLPDVQGQLQGYKVVTALLCCVLVVLLLMRFTKPTVKALQKRLSDRRQNRWIGPTQSHSVSYHRGKTAVKNNDGEKRLSYPALERLTVSDSREPSSNRNSGYNF